MKATRRPPKDWTDADDEIIRRQYPDVSIPVQATADRLGVTADAVKNRAHRIGACRDRFEAIALHNSAMRAALPWPKTDPAGAARALDAAFAAGSRFEDHPDLEPAPPPTAQPAPRIRWV